MKEVGVFGVDPGGATGLAWGVFDPGSGSIAEVLQHRSHTGSLTVEGDERTQIRLIAGAWQRFYKECIDADLEHTQIWFVCEDYIYTAGNTYGGDSAGISTSLIWGVEGYRMGIADAKRGSLPIPTMVLQTAGNAKGFVTSQRLKDWGIWVVGKDHERSAWQHVAYFLQRYLSQHR